mgnify:CR=1 FL=1
MQYIQLGHPSIVCTGHRPPISLFSTKNPYRYCISELVSFYSKFYFKLELKYHPGKFNCVADYLSRLPSPLSIDNLDRSPVLTKSDRKTIVDDDIESPDICVTLLTGEKPLVKYIPTLEVSLTLKELKHAKFLDDF